MADPKLSQSAPVAGDLKKNALLRTRSRPFDALRTVRVEQGSSAFAFGSMSALDQQRIQTAIEDKLIAQLDVAEVFHLSDLLPFIAHGAEVVVQDDFSRCFTSRQAAPWNWNAYLWPIWCVGCVVRYGVLFPIRLLSLIFGFLVSFMLLGLGKLVIPKHERRMEYEQGVVRFLCSVFVFSWTGVLKYNGTIPKKRPNQVYVANHSSMIDMVVLSQMHTFGLVGQKHPGWVGYMQDHVLGSLGNAWFNRGASKDRLATRNRISEHIKNPKSSRLLVFPEGTCVNNEYVVQFKKGVFEMEDVEICPISIKYNKIFVDAFWNSRAESFLMHLIKLMCSWAVVCDVTYLPPQKKLPGETAVQFSNRVKALIAKRAGLKSVDWDGYLKHFRPSNRYVQKRQQAFAASLLSRLATATPGGSPGLKPRSLGGVPVPV